MMAAARARRSPTSFIPSTIAWVRGLSLRGWRIGERLLDDESEMLVAGLLLLGREQHGHQQVVRRGAVCDDQQLGRWPAGGVVAGLALADGFLLAMERGQIRGEPRDLGVHRALLLLAGVDVAVGHRHDRLGVL